VRENELFYFLVRLNNPHLVGISTHRVVYTNECDEMIVARIFNPMLVLQQALYKVVPILAPVAGRRAHIERVVELRGGENLDTCGIRQV
jgi:hypothetical protein